MTTELRDAPWVEIRPKHAPSTPVVSQPAAPAAAPPDLSAAGSAGVVLGLGLGGLIDGICFQQLLQWHHMICVNCGSALQTAGDLRLELFADGIFSVLSMVLMLAGGAMLGAALRRLRVQIPSGFLVGSMLLGWGLFNWVEGIVDHHVLGLHHVRPGPGQFLWDVGYLACGAGLAILGVFLVKRSPRPAPSEAPSFS